MQNRFLPHLRMAALLASVVLFASLLDSAWNTWENLEGRTGKARGEATALTQRVAAYQRQVIEETLLALTPMAGLASLAQTAPARCNAFFAAQMERLPGYLNFGLTGPKGEALCSARPLRKNLVIHVGESTSGQVLPTLVRQPDYQEAGTPPRPVLVLALPQRGDGGGIAAWVFAAMEPSSLVAGIRTGQEQATEIAVFDASGTRLVRWPETDPGASPSEADGKLFESLRERHGGGFDELTGADGVARIYVYEVVSPRGGDVHYLAVGLPTQAFYSQPRGRLFLLAIAMLVVLALILRLAGIGGDHFLRHRLAGLAGSLARGRTALVSGSRSVVRRARAAGRLWRKPVETNPPTRTRLVQANAGLKQSVKELRRHAWEMAKLNEMSQLLQHCQTADEAGPIVGRYAPEFFPDEPGALFLSKSASDLFEVSVLWGDPSPQVEVFTADGCWALRLGKIHEATDPLAGPQCTHLSEPPTCGYRCLPLLAHGEIIGALHLQSRTATPAKTELVQTFAERIATALASLQARDKLRDRAIRDALTGLYNRGFMEETMIIEERRAEREHMPVGLVILDIDHFKRFNDSFGHDAGDTLLRSIGSFLRKQVRDGDIPCRYGGEEFVIILPRTTLETSRQRAEELRQGVAKLQVSHQGKPLGKVTLSLGVASFPDHGNSWQVALKAADMALYQAKQQGRNQVAVASGSGT